MEIPLQTILARLGGRQPAAIISAYLGDLDDVENQRHTEVMTHSAHSAGFAVLFCTASGETEIGGGRRLS